MEVEPRKYQLFSPDGNHGPAVSCVASFDFRTPRSTIQLFNKFYGATNAAEYRGHPARSLLAVIGGGIHHDGLWLTQVDIRSGVTADAVMVDSAGEELERIPLLRGEDFAEIDRLDAHHFAN